MSCSEQRRHKIQRHRQIPTNSIMVIPRTGCCLCRWNPFIGCSHTASKPLLKQHCRQPSQQVCGRPQHTAWLLSMAQKTQTHYNPPVHTSRITTYPTSPRWSQVFLCSSGASPWSLCACVIATRIQACLQETITQAKTCVKSNGLRSRGVYPTHTSPCHNTNSKSLWHVKHRTISA